MAGGYPGLNKVKDPGTYAALKSAWDQILASQAALAALTAIAVTVADGDPLDAKGQRVIDVATPEAAADAVPLGYLYNIVNSLQHNNLKALQGGQTTDSGGEYYHLTAAQWAILSVLGSPTGGNINQAGSKAGGVTLDSSSGTITLNNANLNADTTVSFVLTNSFISSTSLVLVQHESVGALGSYNFAVTPAGGSATIYVRNVTPGNLAEAIVLRFLVLPSA